jgi:surface polysaccharide O-acyltransferase-like enzyme
MDASSSSARTFAEPLPLARPRRMLYGDAVRVIGTLAVVLGHVCDMPLFDPGIIGTGAWWTCLSVDAICRFAVPVYIMLSGALLLDPSRDESASAFYRKRLARIGVPLVFWSAFFLAFAVYYTGWIKDWNEALYRLVIGEPYAHLHFIFRIAGLYALTPALRVFVRHVSRPMLRNTVLILMGIWCADSVINGYTHTSLSAFARFAPFVAWYLAGYWLRECYVGRRQLVLTWLGMLACMATLTLYTGVRAVAAGKVTPYPSADFLLMDFLSPVRIPLSICAWIILVNAFGQRPGAEVAAASPLRRLFSWLAPTTLGLYLIHPLFREILHHPWPLREFLAAKLHLNFFWQWDAINATWPHVLIGIPLVTSIVYFASLASVLLIQKIPGVRRIVD